MDTVNISLQRQQQLSFHFNQQVNVNNWSGRLPAGINVTSDGQGLSGSVSDIPGSYVSNYAYASGGNNAVVTITVSDPNPLAPPDFVCAGATLVSGVMTVTTAAGAIAIQMTATNSGGNWTGSFPSGVGINSFGLISGTLAPGSYSIVVQASNYAWWLNSYTYGPTQTATYALHLVVTPALPVVAVSSQYYYGFGGNFTVGDDMPNGTIFSVQDYAKPVTWSATGLPDGVSINPTSGYVTGKMTTAGSFNAVITATNATGSGTFAQQIIVAANQNAPVVTLAAEQPGNTNQNSYGNVQLSFAVGSPVVIYLDGTHNPTSWSAADLPSGLAIDAATGVVSGILRAPGSYRFFVTATNSVGPSNTLGVTVTATGVAQAFQFISEDFTLTDLQIDQRTGAISSSRGVIFKQYQRARFALIFLDFGVPVAPPEAATVKMGIRPKDQFEADYLFPLATGTLVAAAEGQPAYLLVELEMSGDDLAAELKSLLGIQTATPSLAAMTDVIWSTAGVPRASQTFNFTIQPAVTY